MIFWASNKPIYLNVFIYWRTRLADLHGEERGPQLLEHEEGNFGKGYSGEGGGEGLQVYLK